MQTTKNQLIELLKCIRKAQDKQDKLQTGIDAVNASHTILAINEGMYDAIEILAPELWYEISYYIFEVPLLDLSKDTNHIETKSGKKYCLDSDETFVQYMEDEGFLTENI